MNVKSKCKEIKNSKRNFEKNRKILTKASIYGRKREVEREREKKS